MYKLLCFSSTLRRKYLPDDGVYVEELLAYLSVILCFSLNNFIFNNDVIVSDSRTKSLDCSIHLFGSTIYFGIGK